MSARLTIFKEALEITMVQIKKIKYSKFNRNLDTIATYASYNI